MTRPQELTVDQAAALLGLDRHRVVRLIVEGRLRWTMSKDGATVLVEVPPASLSPKDSATDGAAESKPRSVAPHAATRPSAPTRDGEHPSISDIDAWSKPR